MEAWRNTSYILLTVDDFGVKYVGKEYVTHTVKVLKQYYKIVIDWEGNIYSGLTLDWDYNKNKWKSQYQRT